MNEIGNSFIKFLERKRDNVNKENNSNKKTFYYALLFFHVEFCNTLAKMKF